MQKRTKDLLVTLSAATVFGGILLWAVKSNAASVPLFTQGHRYSITQVIPANAGAPPTLATFQSALSNATSGATAVSVTATATTTTLVIDVTGANVSQGLFSGAVITDMGVSPTRIIAGAVAGNSTVTVVPGANAPQTLPVGTQIYCSVTIQAGSAPNFSSTNPPVLMQQDSSTDGTTTLYNVTFEGVSPGQASILGSYTDPNGAAQSMTMTVTVTP